MNKPNETFYDRVELILKNVEETRNDDILLWVEYLKKHHNNTVIIDKQIDSTKLHLAPTGSMIERIRRQVQNENNKYLPTDKNVRKKRRINQEDWERYVFSVKSKKTGQIIFDI